VFGVLFLVFGKNQKQINVYPLNLKPGVKAPGFFLDKAYINLFAKHKTPNTKHSYLANP
jgi:hypothetical protein